MGLRQLLTPKELKVVKFMLKFADTHPPTNEWEIDFLISIRGFMEADGKLSTEQYTKLQEVFERLE